MAHLERKSFDPKLMERNWDRSNDKYVGFLIEQRKIEAENQPSGAGRDWILLGFLKSISGKFHKANE